MLMNLNKCVEKIAKWINLQNFHNWVDKFENTVTGNTISCLQYGGISPCQDLHAVCKV